MGMGERVMIYFSCALAAWFGMAFWNGVGKVVRGISRADSIAFDVQFIDS